MKNCAIRFNFLFAQIDDELTELEKKKLDFLSENEETQTFSDEFVSNANLAGTVGTVKLVTKSPFTPFDPKISAVLAQQFVDAGELTLKISEIVEVSTLALDLSIKFHILNGGQLQLTYIAPNFKLFLCKNFLKKGSVFRKKGVKRRRGYLFIKRYKFVTVSELLHFYLSYNLIFDFKRENISTWKTLLSCCKNLRLFVVAF